MCSELYIIQKSMNNCITCDNMIFRIILYKICYFLHVPQSYVVSCMHAVSFQSSSSPFLF